MTGQAPIEAAVAAALEELPEGPVGVAVSGGSDSTALLLVTVEAAAKTGRQVLAATVDHGLRAESAEEAAAVAAICQHLGIPHAILKWDSWDGAGNLQDAARQARRVLIGEWARKAGAAAVFLGHTMDDVAETFLMRLARGSGVDGLSAMAWRFEADGASWVRPLLGVGRKELRAVLEARGIGWSDDPSNTDPRFDRARWRAARADLDALGLSVERLAGTAVAMSRARTALEIAVADLAKRAADPSEAGYVLLKIAPMREAAEEVRLRLIAQALMWTSGAGYRPRLESLSSLVSGALDMGADWPGATLHGCIVRRQDGRLLIVREAARTGPSVPAGTVWDGKWRTDGDSGLNVGALGADGLAEIENWRASGHPREALLASPAFRRDGVLIAAPFAMLAEGCQTALLEGIEALVRE